MHYAEPNDDGSDSWVHDPRDDAVIKTYKVLSEPGTSGSPVFCVLPDQNDKLSLYLRGVHFAGVEEVGVGVAFWLGPKPLPAQNLTGSGQRRLIMQVSQHLWLWLLVFFGLTLQPRYVDCSRASFVLAGPGPKSGHLGIVSKFDFSWLPEMRREGWKAAVGLPEGTLDPREFDGTPPSNTAQGTKRPKGHPDTFAPPKGVFAECNAN